MLAHKQFIVNNMLPDTQNKADSRNISINKVGIKDIKHPLIFVDRNGGEQLSVGTWQMTVGLSADVKGTHMSRFIEILNQTTPKFSTENFHTITQTVLEKLEATSAQIEVRFPIFVKKIAPASKVESLLDYDAILISTIESGVITTTLKVVVAVTSLCPCSKSISEYGAHNQRSHITIQAVAGDTLYFEDLIDLTEKSASCQLYAILKREDEKFVTEYAYDNPAFVEDLVRDIAIELKNHTAIRSYILESENFESIHNHSAYALIEG
jgi:GTP cyclohydrolase I